MWGSRIGHLLLQLLLLQQLLLVLCLEGLGHHGHHLIAVVRWIKLEELDVPAQGAGGRIVRLVGTEDIGGLQKVEMRSDDGEWDDTSSREGRGREGAAHQPWGSSV